MTSVDQFPQFPQQGQDQTNPPTQSPSSASSIVHTESPSPLAPTDDSTIEAQKKQRKIELRTLSQRFGCIPDVPIFSAWSERKGCCDAAIHRSLMAGICGNRRYGVYSICLSCLYKDDEDGGDIIFYTGAGGRERWNNNIIPPKRVRLGPQTKDQSWDHPSNKALIVSFLTGNPIRVIRSWRCPSPYAPTTGYRYDGLYKLTAYWTAKGHNGKNICRSRLERLPDQPPIPIRPITISTRRRRRGNLVSEPTPFPYRREDDAQTLVPSEDGHADTATEGAGTEYFSDRGISPTADDLRALASASVERND